MFKRIAAMVIASLVFAIPVFAQDVTPEVTTEPTPVVVVTPPPVVEPPVTPTPVDTSAIPSWLALFGIILVTGIVSIAYVGIKEAGKGLPEWSKELILAGANSGLASLDTYVKTTDTTLDDLAVDELKKLVLKLQEDLRAVQQQVAQVQKVS